MNSIKSRSALVALAVLLATGCATYGRQVGANAFPSGKYHNGDTVAIFNADGTFLGTTTAGNDWVKGTYSVSGNTLTMVDTWESDSTIQHSGKSCVNVPGRYSWTLSDGVLTAMAIDDACDGRKRGTSGVPWTRMN